METTQSVPDILRTILDQLKVSANARTVFGEPVTVGEKVVIPVAEVSYGFGGGSGGSPGDSANTGGSGGGGGGGLRVTPIGVIEITADRTRVVPILDLTKFLKRLLFVWMMVVCMITIRGRKHHRSQ